MQMTDEQVWEDLSRFALAMKRGATVVFNNGSARPCSASDGKRIDYVCVREYDGIREIIEPPQKKVRPLTFDEWNAFAGCVFIGAVLDGHWQVQPRTSDHLRKEASGHRLTCHAPGNPADVRNLWAEE